MVHFHFLALSRHLVASGAFGIDDMPLSGLRWTLQRRRRRLSGDLIALNVGRVVALAIRELVTCGDKMTHKSLVGRWRVLLGVAESD